MSIPPIQASPPTIKPKPDLVPLERLPLPPFVLAMAAVTLLAFLVGLVRMPHAMSEGIGYERAQRALKAGDGPRAVAELEPLVQSHPNSIDLQIDLVEAYIDGHNPKVADLLDHLDGKMMSEDQGKRLDALNQRIFQEVPKP